jgi:hypothetical protein
VGKRPAAQSSNHSTIILFSSAQNNHSFRMGLGSCSKPPTLQHKEGTFSTLCMSHHSCRIEKHKHGDSIFLFLKHGVMGIQLFFCNERGQDSAYFIDNMGIQLRSHPISPVNINTFGTLLMPQDLGQW